MDDQPSLPYGLYNFAKVNSFDNPIDWSELADIGENLNIKVPLKNNTYNYIYGVEIEVTYDPPVNKVVYGTTVLVDLTADTVTPETLMQGYTAHDKSGALITGTATGGGGGTYQAKTNVSPTTSSQTILPDSGYDALSSVQINAMPTGTAGTPSATKGTVSNHSVSVTPSVTNTTGYITGGTKTGTAVTISASELVSGTLSITSSGTKDVTNYASASVAAGGATASATKGSVSNHSVTVTPSVTRTAGYVTAGTANGTAVTVSASELVSGSQTITDNGTVNVTNLASVTVAIPIVTYHTSSSAPTSSQGSDGDLWLVTA